MTRFKMAGAIGSVLAFAPGKAFADGSHAEAGSGLPLNTVLFMVALTALLIFTILFIAERNRAAGDANTRTAGQKNGPRKAQRPGAGRAAFFKRGSLVSLTALVLIGGYNIWQARTASAGVKADHIHGLGYSPDGQTVSLASHAGILSYSAGHWSVNDGERHDYMGFSAYHDGFYASGHPAEGSKLKNPLGIVRSADGGKTLESVTLMGTTDFHMMAAGFHTGVLYVMNPASSSVIEEQGLHVSKDGGRTWTKGSAAGVQGEPTALAAHPEKENVVALGTQQGLYLSTDAGRTFSTISEGTPITAAAFGADGKLYAGTYIAGTAGFLQMDTETKEQTQWKLPALTEDAVSYIAQNPEDLRALTISTFKNEVFQTSDGGAEWHAIMTDGAGQ